VEVPALADLFAAHVPDSPPQWTSGAGDAPPCEVESIMDSAAWSALWSALAALGALAVTVIMALQYFAERGERGFVTRARKWTTSTRARMLAASASEAQIEEGELEYAIWADGKNLLRLLSNGPGRSKVMLK